MPFGNPSFTQLPPNSTGPKLATGPTYTEGGNVLQDEKVILGEQYLASYVVAASGLSTGAATHLMQVMSGATLKLQIRRILVYQLAMATAVTMGDFIVSRLTTAGTGGTVITPVLHDPADPASGATAMTIPTVLGTTGSTLWRGTGLLQQTLGASAQFAQPLIDLDLDRLHMKPWVVAAGVTNGIAIRNVGAYAGATLAVVTQFTEGGI
jgi:hypothetical protein